MAYIEAHQSLRDHRKILALAAELDMPEPHVAGHCLFLWLWAIDNAPEGDLPASTRIIERAAAWVGTAGAFVAAMVKVGMLDQDSGLRIHDWYDYAGRLIEKRRENAARMRAARAATDEPRATHVQRTFTARAGATVAESTVADRSVADHLSPTGSTQGKRIIDDGDVAAATAAARSDPLEEVVQIAEQVAAGMKWAPGSYDPDDLLAVLRCYPDADGDELVKEARKCRQAAPKYHKRADLVWLDNWLRKAFPRQQAAVAAAAPEPDPEPLPEATEPPPPLPAVSLAGYREDARTWRAVAAELRKTASATRFDTVYGGAKLLLPPKNAPPDADAIPVLVLHGRASLELSDRYTREIAAAFQAAAPHIASLRRVCAAQIVTPDAADEAACISPADGLPPAEPASVIPMAAHRSAARRPSSPKGA